MTPSLEVREAGLVSIEARVPGEDAVVRTIPVKSAGQPFRVEHGGTLGAPRRFTLALPKDTLAGSAQVTLTVVPGALSLLRGELAAAPERSGLDDDGYLLALTGRAPALAARLGADLDGPTIVRLTRVAGQRLARHALNPDLLSAMRLAPGALLHPADTLIGRNAAHLAGIVARAQLPDGTFGGGTGWTVQRLLVATADGLDVVRAHPDAARARAATLRARGAFERFSGQVDDPFTAASLLATGTIEGDLQAALRKRVGDALVAAEDGARSLPVPPDVTRADGAPPSAIEATALAVLGLHDDPAAGPLLPDLGATLIGAYRPGAGFGDGITNRRAIEAVALLFSQPIPRG